MGSRFSSMNENVVIYKGAPVTFMFSKFFPTNEGLKKKSWLWNLLTFFFLALVVLTEISLILYILSTLNP